MDKLCPTCGSCTPEYLLGCDWKNELSELLCDLENIHHLSNAKNMNELELYGLLITLKRQNNQHEKT